MGLWSYHRPITHHPTNTAFMSMVNYYNHPMPPHMPSLPMPLTSLYSFGKNVCLPTQYPYTYSDRRKIQKHVVWSCIQFMRRKLTWVHNASWKLTISLVHSLSLLLNTISHPFIQSQNSNSPLTFILS